jgi:hypothetical protein
MEQAVAEVDLLLESDPLRAREALASIRDSRAYCRSEWSDPILHPHVLRWVKHKHLHGALASWLKSSYHPYYHEQLRPIAASP